MSAVILNPPRLEAPKEARPTHFVRRDRWPERLALYLAQASARPFVWGEFDCALFVAGAIEAMTGVDLAQDFRGRYNTLAGARRQFARYHVATFDGLVTLVVRNFHVHEIAPSLAQRGDMVLFDGGNCEFDGERGAQLGIVDCDGRRIATLAQGGVAYIPVALARRAWAIGRIQ